VACPVEAIEDLGNFKIVTARLGSHRVKLKVDEDSMVGGETAWLLLPPERTKLYADDLAIG
jgi:glycerol transport system ATP-binding protein